MPDISRLRDVAVVGPHHSGKTTLVEALLAHCGAITRRGSVHDGTTTTDFEPESIGHSQSTCVGFAHTACGEVDLNLIDCPGFVDFFEETKLAVLAADAAIVVVDPDPNDNGDPSDAQIVGRIILATDDKDDDVQADDEVTAHAGMGGQGVLPIPLVYNGWVQNLPNSWKKLLTNKQLNPIP